MEVELNSVELIRSHPSVLPIFGGEELSLWICIRSFNLHFDCISRPANFRILHVNVLTFKLFFGARNNWEWVKMAGCSEIDWTLHVTPTLRVRPCSRPVSSIFLITISNSLGISS